MVLLTAGSLACRDRAREQRGFSATTAFLTVAVEANVSAATDADARTTTARAATEIAQIAARVDTAVARGEGAPAALLRVLFDELRYRREVDSKEPRFMLLPPVLRDRRGSCVGLGTLYLAVAEHLGLEAHGILVPGHFFVRVGQGEHAHDVELLRRGEEMPARFYRERYGLPATGHAAAYLRPLSTAEVTAVIRFNLGNALREAGDVRAARAAYARAVADFPEFPEAQASLGLAQHLLGELFPARRAYEAARRLQPTLPGLDRNLAVLEAEIAGASPPPPTAR